MEKDIMIILLSFVVPIVLLSIAFGIKGIYPAGPFTILTLDLKAQYMPFFASLRNIGNSDNSLFFNMSGALGNNFMGLAYYIFSPLTWTTTFFSLDNLPDVLYVHTLLRIGGCGASFCYYLVNVHTEKKQWLVMVLLAVCYALTSYNVGYSQNIMWLDAVLMLPLILVGIEKALEKDNPNFLVVCIFISLVLNYYISFMSAVFSFFYFCIRMYELNKWCMRRFCSFIVYGLLGMGLSMPFILPGILALSYGRLSEKNHLFSRLWRYDIGEVLGQLLSCKYDMVYEDGLPLIFCGTITLLLVLCYFIKSNEHTRIKVMWLVLICLYLFSMCFIPLDNIMNGFVEPTWFEARYSYAFCCMLLILAYRGFESVENKIVRAPYTKVITALITIFVFTELFFNSSTMISGLIVELHYDVRSYYSMILNAKRELLESINDDSFFRVSDYEPYTYNDSAWLGYNGFGYFSSCYNRNVMDFLGALGENQSHHILRDGDRTPLEESFLGAKYRIGNSKMIDMGNPVTQNGLYAISKNESSLSLGYMTELDRGVESIDFKGNPFENQNIMARDFTGIDKNVFVELPQYQYTSIEDQEAVQHDSFWVDVEKGEQVWLCFEIDDSCVESVARANNLYYINGMEAGEFIDPYTESSHMIYMGKANQSESLKIEFLSSKYKGTMHVAYLDEKVYSNVIDRLDDNQFEITEHSAGHFCGEIDAGEGGMMLLSLPYIKGWDIKVDGERVQLTSYRDALLKVELSEGEHDIDISYVSPGLYWGFVIGGVSLLIMIIGGIYRRHFARSLIQSA